MSSTRRHAAKRRANRKSVAPARLAQRRAAYDQFPFRPPSLSSTRRWLNASVADGDAERTVEHTGKPGRPPHLFRITPQGMAKPAPAGSYADLVKDLQARKLARMEGLSYEAALQVAEQRYPRPSSG